MCRGDFMRILLLNIPNSLNYGSMMMAENLMRYLGRGVENLTFIIETPKPEESVSRFTEALKDDWGNFNLDTVAPEMLTRKQKLKRYFSWLMTVLFGTESRTLLPPGTGQVDLVVVLGGDDFSEDYSVLGPVLACLRLAALRKMGIKVVMCGQTIGPFHSWRTLAVRWLLGRVNKVLARDPITKRYLVNELKLKNAHLVGDLAFLPLSREFEKPNLPLTGDYFAIVPSELLWRYAREPFRHKYIDFMVEICSYLLEGHPESQLLILPHVLAPDGADDTLAGRDLMIGLKRLGVSPGRLVFPQGQMLPGQARYLIENSKLLITGRMHGSISSFCVKVPPLVLSYSRKYWGIIDEYLGMGDLIVDVRYNGWDEITDACKDKLDYILENREKLTERISDKLVPMEKAAMLNIEILCKELV
jgi:colanic acid/amylovoran biosynthesis protein